MANRASDYIQIAEQVRSRELSAELQVERLNSRRRALDNQRWTLNREIEGLDASIMAAEYREREDDEDDSCQSSQADMLRSRRAQCMAELSAVAQELDSVEQDLAAAHAELTAVQTEKARVLAELQDQARKTAGDIGKLGGMVGSFAAAGAAGSRILQQRQATLSRAAAMLGGATVTASGVGGAGVSRSGGSGGTGTSRGSVGAAMRGSGGARSGGAVGASGSGRYSAPQAPAGPAAAPQGEKKQAPAVQPSGPSQQVSSQPQKKAAAAKTAAPGRSGKKSAAAKKRWHSYPPGTNQTNYVSPYRKTTYQSQMSYRNPVTKQRETVTLNRTVFQHANLDPMMEIPVGTSYGNGRCTTEPINNLQRMLAGKPPFVKVWDDEGNERIVMLELHHLTGQETLYSQAYFGGAFTDGTMAEVPAAVHDQFDKQLHIQGMPSFRKNADGSRSADNKKYTAFLEQYWKSRAQAYLQQTRSGGAGEGKL